MVRTRTIAVGLSLLLAATLSLRANTADELIAKADDHYFNLEHDESIELYKQALAARPGDPNICTAIATAVLYKELHRLGLLDSSGLNSDNRFLDEERPEPDPEAAAEFEQWLEKAEEFAEPLADKDPPETDARYAISNVYALRANYQFMVDKSYFAALRNGGRARKFSKRLIKDQPDFVDSYLVAGVHEYVIGSLPWAVKALVALGGVNGSKKTGEEYVQRVIQDGQRAKTQARILMALLHRREHRPLQAAELLTGLIEEFPRNYVLRLERASMYAQAQDPARSLEEYERVRKMIADSAPGYSRVPKWQREALDERIGELRDEVKQEQQTLAQAPGS